MKLDLFGGEYDPSGAPLTQERLKEILHYDPDTGEWRWLIKPRDGMQIGDKAGWGRNRRHIEFNGRQYRAARLAFFYMTGNWPSNDMDHKSRKSSDERWSNLRSATRLQNNQNAKLPITNTSGYKGVYFNKKLQMWVAQINNNKKHIYLGSFNTAKEAAYAYDRGARQYHGEFAVLNFPNESLPITNG
jgi:hypothetical protein